MDTSWLAQAADQLLGQPSTQISDDFEHVDTTRHPRVSITDENGRFVDVVVVVDDDDDDDDDVVVVVVPSLTSE